MSRPSAWRGRAQFERLSGDARLTTVASVGALLLAAGRSRRFGSDKRAAVLADGRTLLDSVLNTLARAELPVLICLDPADSHLATRYQDLSPPPVLCDRAREGMGGTLAQGAAALPAWDACVIALADMPWVQVETLRALAGNASLHNICVPEYGGRRGNPVCFGRDFFVQLRACCGDQGARKLLAANAEHVRIVPVEDPGIHADVDTPSALKDTPA